jgi:hypothetical protein
MNSPRPITMLCGPGRKLSSSNSLEPQLSMVSLCRLEVSLLGENMVCVLSCGVFGSLVGRVFRKNYEMILFGGRPATPRAIFLE